MYTFSSTLSSESVIYNVVVWVCSKNTWTWTADNMIFHCHFSHWSFATTVEFYHQYQWWPSPVISWGEAMSPPVLGTLLGLAIAYIIPAENGWLPLDTPESDAKDAKEAETKDFKKKSGPINWADHFAKVDYAIVGLSGVCLTPPGCPDRLPCHFCELKFKEYEVTFEWTCTGGEVIHLHEPCLLAFSHSKKEDRVTLARVRTMTMKTSSMLILSSLFTLEDSLQYCDRWAWQRPIVDPDKPEADHGPGSSGSASGDEGSNGDCGGEGDEGKRAPKVRRVNWVAIGLGARLGLFCPVSSSWQRLWDSRQRRPALLIAGRFF